jgi:hypothetical protein
LDGARVARAFESTVWGESFTGKLAVLTVQMNDLNNAFGAFARAVGKTFGGGTPEEPWLGFFRKLCADIGLDFPEAVAFVRRGESEEGKMARIKALAVALDFGGLNACIGLVYSDAAQEDAA